jgi:hypothetical protein
MASGGQWNNPCCSCFQISTRPLLSQTSLDAVAALAAVDDVRAQEWIFGQHFLRHPSKAMGTFTEINLARGQQGRVRQRER